MESFSWHTVTITLDSNTYYLTATLFTETLTKPAVTVAGKRQESTPPEGEGRWRGLGIDARTPQSDTYDYDKRWHHRQNYPEKHTQQQQRQQQPNTPRRRYRQYLDGGLRGTRGTSPRPATALPWTSEQVEGDRSFKNRNTNNASTPLSSGALTSSVPKSARQRRHGPSSVRASTSVSRPLTSTGRRGAGSQKSVNSVGHKRGGLTVNGANSRNYTSDGAGQFVTSNNKSQSTSEGVSCSNPYRNFCENLTSSTFNGKKNSNSIPPTTNDISYGSKIDPSHAEFSSFYKQGGTGGETYRSSVKDSLSLGTLKQSLYEDEFNQAESSPIHLQLQTARSTNLKFKESDDVKIHVSKNSDRPPVERSSRNSIRPKSSYTVRNTEDKKFSNKTGQIVREGVSQRRPDRGYHANDADTDRDNDSGRFVVDRKGSARFYIADDEVDDEEADDYVGDGTNDGDDGRDFDESDETGDRRSDSIARGLHQGKRGSVTFDVPDEEKRSKPFSRSRQSARDSSLSSRRMSAPELPPIADTNAKPSRLKGDKRKTSTNSVASSGSKASINQLAAAVNSKTFYNRKATNSNTPSSTHTESRGHKKKKLPIPRNHSDSSLKGLIANNSVLSQDSGGSIPEGGSGGGAAAALKQTKFVANGHRALSWCATENSGSQTKLETLFEGQNIISGNTKVNGTLSYANNNNNNGSNGNLPGYMLNGGTPDNTMPIIPPPRSVSVNGLRSRDELSRAAYAVESRHLQSDAGDVEIATVDDFVSRSRMRRSQSENKLGGGKHFSSTTSLNSNNNNNNINTKNHNTGSTNESRPRPKPKQKQSRGMTRNLSVDRIDKLTSKPSKKSVSSNPFAGATNSRMRRVNSVSALNTNKTPYYTTISNNNNNNNNNNNSGTLNRNEPNQDDGYNDFEDEECVEASARLVEWLNVVNNVDEYDTDPKDTVIDYLDEPPQTDTAVHVVYSGD